MASQITGVSIIYFTVCSGADQRKLQSSASLAFVSGIHRWLVNSPRKKPATRKIFLFDDVIICNKASYYRTCRWSSNKEHVRSHCIRTYTQPSVLIHSNIYFVYMSVGGNHVATNIETEVLSFWWHFRRWLHWKLSFLTLLVQPVVKMSSKWRLFHSSEPSPCSPDKDVFSVQNMDETQQSFEQLGIFMDQLFPVVGQQRACTQHWKVMWNNHLYVR